MLSLTAHSIARLQNFIDGDGHGATQFFAVGTSLYYVMRDQVGAGTPDNVLTVWKSTDKTTWVQVAQLPAVPFQVNAVSRDCPAVLVGALIYIADQIDTNPGVFPANNQQVLHIFDTGTDAFLTDSALAGINIVSPNGGVLVDQAYSISAFNNGTILLSFLKGENSGLNDLQLQLYTIATDTWSAATNVLSDDSRTIQQIHDPVSDLAFVFFRKASTRECRCLTVDNTLTFSNVTVATPPSGPGIGHGIFGLPIITTSTTEIIIPIRWFPLAGAPFLKAARATVATTPTFTVDTVDDLSTLPAGMFVQQWDQSSACGWMCQEIAGLLYALYDISKDLDSALSQSFLYYRSSTAPGVWSAAAIAYTTVVPGEQLQPYGVNLPGFDPIILVGVIDPTLYPAIASLTNFILFPVQVNPSVTCDNPPLGQVGVAYTHTFPASSGTPPYTFSISVGALPTGLSLAAATGIVSGKPTVAGTFSFTVLVTDANSLTGSVACSIEIAPGGIKITFCGVRRVRKVETPRCDVEPERTKIDRVW
jgi:hypothetical protein